MGEHASMIGVWGCLESLDLDELDQRSLRANKQVQVINGWWCFKPSPSNLKVDPCGWRPSKISSNEPYYLVGSCVLLLVSLNIKKDRGRRAWLWLAKETFYCNISSFSCSTYSYFSFLVEWVAGFLSLFNFLPKIGPFSLFFFPCYLIKFCLGSTLNHLKLAGLEVRSSSRGSSGTWKGDTIKTGRSKFAAFYSFQELARTWPSSMVHRASSEFQKGVWSTSLNENQKAGLYQGSLTGFFRKSH